MGAQTSNAPTWQGRGAESVHGEANARILLDRLDGVQPSGNGWRARCPACGGRSRKVSIAESGGKVLVHCFAGCKAEDVIGAVGLTWADLFPPRHWPDSPEERRQQRQAIQQAGWAAALATLATEATIVRLAAAQVARWQPLSEEDDARLALACERIDKAAAVLVGGGR
ncbi:hypothetical protein [uncultured Pigmentiphaga sp.]|uniref:hypothetical protein n=1 Tax=uncultured Pigmentiphaga sp. TaxID=340361 RepID=UPI00261DD798|nr:hypothetical protein [uncultured Pigmentiphaga sp.]